MASHAAKEREEIFDMIKVNEALKIILDSVDAQPSETIKLAESLSRVVSEDISSDVDIPLLDNSAMDGYAVKASDTTRSTQNNPSALKVVEDLRAGYLASREIHEKEAIRIMTGAPIPDGAYSVVMFEFTEKDGKDAVKIFKEVTRGENVRRSGEDIKNGELVIKKGTLLNSAHIGIAASLGKSSLKVARRPRVAVLATGDEVIDVNEKLAPGKLRNSNTYTLCSQVLKSGGIPKNLGIAKDEPDLLESKIREGFDCDIILTSGGVSVGDYDLVKHILAKTGTDIKFWKVAMRPGKPLVFGKIFTPSGKGIPIFGLPGNPVSSMVSFEVFVRPTIIKMLGQERDSRKELDAVLEEDIK
ncbi:MAG: gephyrin-like molybdotransferase Glp, partial [Candidatus Omnitrophota bacterium]